ncbi:hypothetical protein [Hyalangium versicolor]|uniref:hypothetical protein n=1 Tax=Hyalangium versicolor TaxID=2861190 RepID=UPI001CCD6224|nr:hypothetical protein [Hyalangium versicolor]
MKAWMAALVFAVVPLVACGPSQELEHAREQVDALQQENAKLKTRVSDLEGSLQNLRHERDQLKLAAAAKPAPAPAPAAAPAKKTSAPSGTAARK